MHRSLMVGLAATSLAIGSLSAFANEEAAKRWIDSEFQPSVLSKEQQMEEMRWFIKAAAPFKGM
jgi:glycerol transport system substrate-binding protein